MYRTMVNAAPDMYNYGLEAEPIQPVQIIPENLRQLFFTGAEIDTYISLIETGCRITVPSIINMGIPANIAKRVRYMHEICQGKVTLNDYEDYVKHLKKLDRTDGRRIGIADLAVSSITKVPRAAVVQGIPGDSPFAIYNTVNLETGLYEVADIRKDRIVIYAKKRPVLPYGTPTEVEGVCSIMGASVDGKKLAISVNKKNCRMVNRFIIVASTKRPEFHHGMNEIVDISGSRVYVYAQTLRARDVIQYNMGTQRVYAYGFSRGQIAGKLDATTNAVYQYIRGVLRQGFPGNQDFRMIERRDTGESNETDLDN